MATTKGINLTHDERAALENAWRHSPSRGFRRRCQMILLKAEFRTSQDIAAQIGGCEVVVSTWLKCYRARGMEGLQTRDGQGRRAILQTQTDLDAVRRAVQKNRQRISLVKAELEEELGKTFSTPPLRRFLKKTASNASGDG